MFSSSEISSGSTTAKENMPHHTCRMVYQGEGHPFLLIFRQGPSLMTTCQFTTISMEEEGEGEEELRLDLGNIVQQVIIPGKIMAEAISELNTIRTVTLTIRASSTIPRFALISHGSMGISQFAFPNEKRVLELFHIQNSSLNNNEEASSSGKEVTIANSYNFDLIMKAYEAMSLASRISLRCDVNGFMSLQSMYEVGDGRSIFIDFRFAPIEDEDFQNMMDKMGF